MDRFLIFDLDGCGYNSQPYMAGAYYRHSKHRTFLRNWRADVDITDTFCEITGATRAEAFELLYGDDMVLKVKPLKGAQKFVQQLARLKNPILPVVSTGRPESQRDVTLHSLKRYFPQIEPEHVFMSQKGVSSELLKLENYIKFNAVGMVDDLLKVILYVQTHAPAHLLRRGYRALIDKPWNRHATRQQERKTLRIGNWDNGDPGWDTFYNLLAR